MQTHTQCSDLEAFQFLKIVQIYTYCSHPMNVIPTEVSNMICNFLKGICGCRFSLPSRNTSDHKKKRPHAGFCLAGIKICNKPNPLWIIMLTLEMFDSPRNTFACRVNHYHIAVHML